MAQPVAPEQQVQDDIEVQQENVEVLQEIEVEAVEGEAQQGVVVAEQPQRIADMPPNLVQLLVQQQQTVQREHTNEELQQSPAAGLPVPRFNTPSPDLNQTRSSIFSSVGKPPALSSGGSSRSSSSSLGCRPLPQSPLHSRQDSSDIPAQQQPTPPAPRRQLYWLPTASSSPVGPSFRLLTSSQSTTPSGQPAVSQSAPRLSALRQHSPILSAPLL